MIAALKDADAAIAEYGQFTERVFRALPNLKIVSNYAMGVDNIDVEAAKAAGVAVTNSPDYCFDEVAEHGMTLISALLRNIVGYAMDVADGIWDWSKAPKLQRIKGLTLGLIGCGQIPAVLQEWHMDMECMLLAMIRFFPRRLPERWELNWCPWRSFVQGRMRF